MGSAGLRLADIATFETQRHPKGSKKDLGFHALWLPRSFIDIELFTDEAARGAGLGVGHFDEDIVVEQLVLSSGSVGGFDDGVFDFTA